MINSKKLKNFKNLTELNYELDLLIYKLYGLNESEIKMQLTKDFGRSKKAISRRLQGLGLLEIKNKHITEPKLTLDEIRTSAKENNNRGSQTELRRRANR